MVVAKGTVVMSALLDTLRAWAGRLRTWLDGPNTLAHCPNDDWDFAPYFTDGKCPLDGWRPAGHVPTPMARRIDWFWPLAGATTAVSIVMAVLVVMAYNH
ncbi:MAG TPA: hypothetical protein DCQ30_05540 [Acidimicrobiaceae bacterium]|nr:hypothetical protein [Acidimicrobiaceae bacterium]